MWPIEAIFWLVMLAIACAWVRDGQIKRAKAQAAMFEELERKRNE